MFDPQYVTPIPLFSFQHILALVCTAAGMLTVYLLRHYFMQHQKADQIFRYALSILMLLMEFGFYFYNGKIYKDSLAEMLPTHLCSHVFWVVIIALLSDSRRLIRLFAPIAMTGGFLSLIFVNMDASFPHFRAFHYFMVHGGFVLGVFYFFFTRKVPAYTWHDLGWSCFTIFSMSAFIFMLNAFSLADSYFLVSPPPVLAEYKGSLGQVGYTTIYLGIITVVMCVNGSILHFATRKRDPAVINLPAERPGRITGLLSRMTERQRTVLIFISISVFVYLTVLQKMTLSELLFWMDVILLAFILVLWIFSEKAVNCSRYVQKSR